MTAVERLKQLGLTEGEAKVYVALLQLGSSTVGPIAKRSKVAYSKIYEILGRLLEKGFVSVIIKSQTRHYQPVGPNRIEEYLKKKEQEIEKERNLLHDLIPELETLQTFAIEHAEAEVFVGWKGMYAAEQKLIEGAKKGEEVLYFYIYDEKTNERAEQLFTTLNHLYKARKLKLRGISNPAYRTSPHVKKVRFKRQRYVHFPIPNNIDICKDKTFIASWKTPMGVLITSQEIADNFRAMFEDIWQKAER
jgi:HTH-type transcriptional regulator, sugar sensing transcriptional regulator